LTFPRDAFGAFGFVLRKGGGDMFRGTCGAGWIVDGTYSAGAALVVVSCSEDTVFSCPGCRSLPMNGFTFVGGGDGVVATAVNATLRRLAVPPSGKSTWPESMSQVGSSGSFSCRKMQFGRAHVSLTGQSTDLNAEELQANMTKE